MGAGTAAIATPVPPTSPAPLRAPAVCPADLDTLTQGLVRDVPSYANRVARRQLGLSPDGTGFGTVLVAGQLELDPLDLTTLTVSDHTAIAPPDVHQVFFTTLERHYTASEAVTLEQYHWLFLTAATDGWHLALMFTRTAPTAGTQRPPTPPQENSDGIVGQAVQLWLRDCRAGAVAPLQPPAGAATDTDADTGL